MSTEDERYTRRQLKHRSEDDRPFDIDIRMRIHDAELARYPNRMRKSPNNMTMYRFDVNVTRDGMERLRKYYYLAWHDCFNILKTEIANDMNLTLRNIVLKSNGIVITNGKTPRDLFTNFTNKLTAEIVRCEYQKPFKIKVFSSLQKWEWVMIRETSTVGNLLEIVKGCEGFECLTDENIPYMGLKHEPYDIDLDPFLAPIVTDHSLTMEQIDISVNSDVYILRARDTPYRHPNQAENGEVEVIRDVFIANRPYVKNVGPPSMLIPDEDINIILNERDDVELEDEM